jgi:hypothetical protein
MRYLVCLLLCFCLLPDSYAQRGFFNTDAFWSRFQRDDHTPPRLTAADTAILVASSRVVQDKDPVRFVGEERDCGGLHYYFVYARKGTWHVFPVKNITEGLSYMPAPDNDWAVYADGFGKIFTSGIDRGMRMAAQQGVHVLYLDYPSYNTSKKLLGNYKFAVRNAHCAYNDFVPVLDSVIRLRKEGKMGRGHLSLFFHSMGNIILRETVRNGRLPELNGSVWVDNLILNAPCVPQRHHKDWLDKITFAKRIYVHYNPQDHVLKGAHLVSFTKQLGEKLRMPLSDRAAYVNFHTIAGDNHSNFLILLQHPVPPKASLDYYRRVLHGTAVDTRDTLHFRVSGHHSIGADLMQ